MICRVTQSLHGRDDLVVAEVGAFFHAVDMLVLFYQVFEFRAGNLHVGEEVGNFDEKFCLDAVVSFRACGLDGAQGLGEDGCVADNSRDQLP